MPSLELKCVYCQGVSQDQVVRQAAVLPGHTAHQWLTINTCALSHRHTYYVALSQEQLHL